MRLIALLLLQSAPSPPISFDLATLPAPPLDCAGSGSDVVICARRHEAAPAIPPAPEPVDGMPRAEMRLFGEVRGSLHGEQANVGGFTSNRAMVTIAVPF